MIFSKKENKKIEGNSTLAPQSSDHPKNGPYNLYQNGDVKIGRVIAILISENVRPV